MEIVKSTINALDANEVNKLETIEEIRKIYKDANDSFKNEVSEINEKEKLDELEQDLMKIMDEHDKHIKEVEYELPDGVKFEDEQFTRNKISARIKSLLERHTIEFTYIYGLYNLAKFWAGNPQKITYGTLDSTLRLLEQLKYDGKDWRWMMVINAYFQKSNEEYNKDLTRTIFLAERHNIILERMQILEPMPVAEEEVSMEG